MTPRSWSRSGCHTRCHTRRPSRRSCGCSCRCRCWSGTASFSYSQSNWHSDQGTHRIIAADANVGVVCSYGQFARIHIYGYFLAFVRRDIARSRAQRDPGYLGWGDTRCTRGDRQRRVLVSVDQLTDDTRLTGRGINRVEIGCPAVVVDARQVKRTGCVVEIEPDSAVCVEPERSNRRHFSGVFVDCEESITQDIDSEHTTDWIHSDTDNRHALWNAEKVTDYRRHHFVTPIDASQEEVGVGKGREVIRADSVKRVRSRVPRHTPPSLNLRRALHPSHIDRWLACRRVDREEVLATIIYTEVLTEVVPNECPCKDIPRDQIADHVGITGIGNVVEPLVKSGEGGHGELVPDGKGARGEGIGLAACMSVILGT
jgi:hypothetical protein